MPRDQALGSGLHATGGHAASRRPGREDIGQLRRIAGVELLHEADELLPPARRDMADHAEIEQRDAVAGQAEQVAGMRIAVETAVDQHHVEHEVGAQLGDRGGIDARGAERLPSRGGRPWI